MPRLHLALHQMRPDYISDIIQSNTTQYLQRALNKFKLKTKVLPSIFSPIQSFFYTCLLTWNKLPTSLVISYRLIFSKVNLNILFLFFKTNYSHIQAQQNTITHIVVILYKPLDNKLFTSFTPIPHQSLHLILPPHSLPSRQPTFTTTPTSYINTHLHLLDRLPSPHPPSISTHTSALFSVFSPLQHQLPICRLQIRLRLLTRHYSGTINFRGWIAKTMVLCLQLSAMRVSLHSSIPQNFGVLLQDNYAEFA